MEIKIEYNVYPKSGTKGIDCYIVTDSGRVKHHDIYTISVLSNNYVIEHSYYSSDSINYVQTTAKQDIGFTINNDIVQDPKNISDEDFQLLKILNPNVTDTQFNIFKELKLYLDNHQTEDYTLDQVKQILKDKGEWNVGWKMYR